MTEDVYRKLCETMAKRGGRYPGRDMPEFYSDEMDEQNFDLDVSWIWDRVQSPQPYEDGTIPKKDNVRLTVGIGIDF